MPPEPAYTDTVVSILTDHLGPDTADLLAHTRHPGQHGGDPLRAALAEHLTATAREASRLERILRERLQRLSDFLIRARQDLTLLHTTTRWEAVGISGTACDQAAARFGDALQRLAADAHLYTQAIGHLPAPAHLAELRTLAESWHRAAEGEHGGNDAEHNAAAALAEAVRALTTP